MTLYNQLLKLAHAQPHIRKYLVPLLRKEASMRREAVRVKQFEQMLKKPGEFGILTAYGPGSKSENKQLQGELIKDLQKKGYKFEHLKGKWEGLTEKSLIVPNIKAQDLFELGKKYGQISVIHKNKSGVVGMYYLKENKVEVAIKPDKEIAAEISEGSDLWSKSRGTSFSFDFLWGQKQPWNGSSSIGKDTVVKWINEGKLKPEGGDASESSKSEETKKEDDSSSKKPSAWWDGLSDEEKKRYCEDHGSSSYC